jgi:Ribonuclease G/E
MSETRTQEQITLDRLIELEEDCDELETTWVDLKERTKAAKESLDEATEYLRKSIRDWKADRDKITLPFGQEANEHVAQLDAEANGEASSAITLTREDYELIGKTERKLRKRNKKGSA